MEILMTTQLIGLAGYKRSGKNSVADVLVKHGWTGAALADALRAEVLEKYGVHPCEDSRKEEKVYRIAGTMRSYRDLLIEHGQGMRASDPAYWVKQLEARVAPLLREGTKVVITDVRMPNEIQWIHARSGRMVWVARQGVESNGHATEQDQSTLCDYEIQNHGGLADLAKTVGYWLETLPTRELLRAELSSIRSCQAVRELRHTSPSCVWKGVWRAMRQTEVDPNTRQAVLDIALRLFKQLPSFKTPMEPHHA